MAKMSDAELMKQVRNLAASNSKSGVARELISKGFNLIDW